MTPTWSHAFVYVTELNRMLQFYEDVLGFKVTDRTESMAFISSVEDEHHQLAFATSEDRPTTSKVSHFAFRVETLEDVKDTFERLQVREENLEVAPVTHGNTWSIYFTDPEGNGIELFCDTPWSVKQPFSEPWNPTLSAAEIHDQTYRRVVGADGFAPNPRT